MTISSIDWDDFKTEEVDDWLSNEILGWSNRRPQVSQLEIGHWRKRRIYSIFIKNLKERKQPNHIFY